MVVLPFDCQEVVIYLFTCFGSPENACLGISFMFDITVPTAFVL
jgi:hypothetical protein